MAHSRMCVFCILTFCFYVAFRSKWGAVSFNFMNTFSGRNGMAYLCK